MAIEFITSKYEFAHGRKPKGYGLWFFEITCWQGSWSHTQTVEVSATGTLSVAKKEAMQKAKTDTGMNKIQKIVLLS